MGTYLSHPVKEKYSESAENNVISFGATAMQGWRINQEDSHNCILHFDQNCSMFAVYDGHGGAEVSDYASKKLGEFVKSAPSWSRGDISVALVEAFLNFDQNLKSPEVIEELQRIKNERKPTVENDVDLSSDRKSEPISVSFESLLEKLGIRFQFNEESPFSDDDVFITRKAVDSDEKCIKCDDNADAVTLPLTPPSSPATAQSSCSHTDGIIEPDAQVQHEPPSLSATASSCVIMDEDSSMMSAVDVQVLTDGDCGGTTMQISTTDDSAVKLLNNSVAFNNTSNPIPDSKEKICTTMETCCFDETDEIKKSSTMEVESVEVKGDVTNEEIEMESDFEQELIVMPSNGETPGADSGSTACVAIIKENTVYVANAGDSRCVLCRNGTAVDMSVDHKPEDKEEKDRIEKAGGKVTPDGRVNAGLNLSRAFGDHSYKKNVDLPPEEQMISAFPDVRVEQLTADDKFLIIACDGIWNSMTSQELVDFVSLRLGKGQTPAQVCEEVCDTCLAPSTIGDGTGCDNMTIIIVILKQLTTTPSI